MTKRRQSTCRWANSTSFPTNRRRRLPWLVSLLAAETNALTSPLPLRHVGRFAPVGHRKRSWRQRDRRQDVADQHCAHILTRQRWSNNNDGFTPLYNSLDDTTPDGPLHNNNSTNPKNNQTLPPDPKPTSSSLLRTLMNPYNAGKSLRSTVTALASAISPPASRLSPERRAIYYHMEDKLGLSGMNSALELKDSTSTTWHTSSDTDTRPEVLIVGATGSLGQILVKRLLLENKVRVRVLVRDLYSHTLDTLGTGVTYCQGSLDNMDSLEYAVTDLDKIVFCAGHETDFIVEGRKDVQSTAEDGTTDENENNNEEEKWKRHLEQRSQGAQKVDGEGLRNLIHAYLNVRHADYGTSQTAKRVLFKFRSHSADFDLFSMDSGSLSLEDADKDEDSTMDDKRDRGKKDTHTQYPTATKSLCSWKQNKFHHGVFSGQIGRYDEAAISTVRLRSRQSPEEGLNLQSGNFAGFVIRICSNGGVYEAFVRTEAYERWGVEYVCEFRTASKTLRGDGESTNPSRDKFVTVRLDFSDFRARLRPDVEKARMLSALNGSDDIPRFVGKDVRQIGFRYRGSNNSYSRGGTTGSTSVSNGYHLSSSSSGWSKFYLSLDYIKLYRGQPEPEFIYLSDARIPPVLQDGMVRDDIHRLVSSSSSSSSLQSMEGTNGLSKMDRSAEETYFKYKGEEIIKQSGLR